MRKVDRGRQILPYDAGVFHRLAGVVSLQVTSPASLGRPFGLFESYRRASRIQASACEVAFNTKAN